MENCGNFLVKKNRKERQITFHLKKYSMFLKHYFILNNFFYFKHWNNYFNSNTLWVEDIKVRYFPLHWLHIYTFFIDTLVMPMRRWAPDQLHPYVLVACQCLSFCEWSSSSLSDVIKPLFLILKSKNFASKINILNRLI